MDTDRGMRPTCRQKKCLKSYQTPDVMQPLPGYFILFHAVCQFSLLSKRFHEKQKMHEFKFKTAYLPTNKKKMEKLAINMNLSVQTKANFLTHCC